MSGTHSESRGRLSTFVGGRQTHFRFNPNSAADRRRAESERRNHDSQVEAAIDARAVGNLGRPATKEELRKGLTLPDTRPVSEQIRAQEVPQGHGTRRNDPDGRDSTVDVNAQHVERLRRQLETTPERLHGPILERIARFEKSSQKFQEQLEARRTREAYMARPEVQDARVIGEATLTLLQCSHDPASQAQLEQAQERLNRLLVDGNVEAFHESHREWLCLRASNLASKEVILREQAAKLEADAAEIRQQRKERDFLPAEAEPAATEQV
jgi:hypothetical protein